MDPSKRVLIVEADNTFALSLAAVLQEAGFASAIAADATEAQRDIRERRPSLVLLRAELPDLSGFTLCGRLRKDKNAQALPIILFSSDATAEALAEHRSHPASAADGYLSIPFPMEDLIGQVQTLLSLAEQSAPPPEDAELMITDEGETVRAAAPVAGPAASVLPGDEDLEGALEGALGGAAIGQPGGEAGLEAMMAPPPPPRPPRLPKRPRRSSLTEEDRTFLDRVFESIADRRTELVAESRNASRRPSIKRELLATPEGKLQVLREELNRREAQVARLSEIWTIRERELTSIDDKLHEKEVEIQGLKMQVDDLLRRLSDARDLFVKKDQEHGATVDSMMLDKFINEKELIEVVASKEKDIAVLRRDLRARDDDLSRRAAELDQGREEINRLEKARSVDLLQFELRERQLSQTLARREVEILGRSADFDESLRFLGGIIAELSALRDEASRLRRELSQELRSVQLERDQRVHELERALSIESARAALAELQAADRLAAQRQTEADLRLELDEADEQLSLLLIDSERLLHQRDGLHQSFTARVSDRDAEIARLTAELAADHERAVAREAQLEAEVSARVEQIGNLEGEIEALTREKEEREAELTAALAAANAQIEKLTAQGRLLDADLAQSRARVAALEAELSDARDTSARALEEAGRIRQALEVDLAQTKAALGGEIDALRSDLERTRGELAETQSEKLRREAELSQQLAEKIEQAGALEGELSAVRAHAEQREEELAGELAAAREEGERLGGQLEQLGMEKARIEGEMSAQLQAVGARLAERDHDLTMMQEQREEREALLEATRADVARLGAELADLGAAKQEGDEAAAGREAALRQDLAEARGQLEAAAQEQTRLLAEDEEQKARFETRTNEVRGEIAERERVQRENEERFQAQVEEGLQRVEQLEAAQAQSQKALTEEQRKLAALQAEKQRREEALGRELTQKTEAIRATEQKLGKRVEELDEQARSLSSQVAELTESGRRTQEQLVARTSEAQGLMQRTEKISAEREGQKKEAAAAMSARDARISELQQSLQASQQERRKFEEDAQGKLQRSEALGKDAQAKLKDALAARERLEKEAQAALAARAKKVTELEQALEAATGTRVRVEKELGQRAQVAEAKAVEVTQKLAATQRVQKELEARVQREGQELGQKHKVEMDRREAQRAQEVSRLQQALQEKAKAVKILELELQRFKSRPPVSASPTTKLPAVGSSPSRPPSAPPPPRPSSGVQPRPTAPPPPEVTQATTIPGMLPGDMDDVPTRVMEKPNVQDDEDDLDKMLKKLEI